MFLLVPAYPGSPGQKAVKRLCVCVCVLIYFHVVVPSARADSDRSCAVGCRSVEHRSHKLNRREK